jgi:hypothetical protein
MTNPRVNHLERVNKVSILGNYLDNKLSIIIYLYISFLIL